MSVLIIHDVETLRFRVLRSFIGSRSHVHIHVCGFQAFGARLCDTASGCRINGLYCRVPVDGLALNSPRHQLDLQGRWLKDQECLLVSPFGVRFVKHLYVIFEE